MLQKSDFFEKFAVLGRNNDRVVPKAEEFCSSTQTELKSAEICWLMC